MSGGMGERTVLAPSGHAAVNQLLVACHALVRADPEALGHAGPEPLEQRIGLLAQFQKRVLHDIPGRRHVTLQQSGGIPCQGPLELIQRRHHKPAVGAFR